MTELGVLQGSQLPQFLGYVREASELVIGNVESVDSAFANTFTDFNEFTVLYINTDTATIIEMFTFN